MEIYNKIEPYNEPGELLNKELAPETEMVESEWGFLCGLIKKFKPRNIVEVGVAEGGTSVLLDICMRLLGSKDHIITSVEKSERYYRDHQKKSGFEYDRAVEAGVISGKNHKFYLGKVLPEVVKEITAENGAIDLIILDTVHSAPGELLDFVAVIPYLKENAVVCLHDVALDYFEFMLTSNYTAYINKMIFDSVSAEKYFNIIDFKEERLCGVPNIAAVRITDETKKNIRDLFSSFSYPWAYYPDDDEIKLYRETYAESYSEECIKVFDKCVALNMYRKDNRFNSTTNSENNETPDYLNQIKDFIKEIKGKNIYLYGTGKRCAEYMTIFDLFDINVEGYIVSDGYKDKDTFRGKNVYEFSEFKEKHSDASVIVAAANPVIEKTVTESGIDYYLPNDMFNIVAYYLYNMR